MTKTQHENALNSREPIGMKCLDGLILFRSARFGTSDGHFLFGHSLLPLDTTRDTFRIWQW